MRAKILIVDDSATSLMWHTLALRGGPYDVSTAPDGEAGVAAARALQPDLVLMDTAMPGMNGAEAARAIRALPGLGDVPIVMVCTRGELEAARPSFGQPGSDYVVKPVDRAELLTAVERRLGARAAAPARR